MHSYPFRLLFSICFLIAVGACLPNALRAQELNWKIRHVSIENGLSNRFVNAIVQDTQGFIWIGTNFGLNRYDGHRIDILTHENNGLQTDIIQSLHVDSKNNLWTVHRQTRFSAVIGIDIIDPVSFEVRTLEEYIPEGLPFETDQINRVLTDDHHSIYLYLRSNAVYKYVKGALILLLAPETDFFLLNGHIEDSTFFFLTSDKRSIVVKDIMGEIDHTYQIAHTVEAHQYFLDRNVGYFGKSSQGSPIFQTVNHQNYTTEVITLTEDGGIEATARLEYPVIAGEVAFWNPHKKQVWCNSASGVFIYDPSDGAVTHPPLLKNEILKTIYFMPTGTIWIGTENGIFIATPIPQYFKVFLDDSQIQYSCRSFAEDLQGSIYVLTHGGNLVFHPNTQSIEKWDLPYGILGIASLTDKAGNIWIGAENGPLYRYNPITKDLKSWVGESYTSHWSLLQARSGEILEGTVEGLWIKNPGDDLQQTPFTLYNGFDLLKESAIYHILETEEGIWLSTTNGLFLIDLKKGVQAHYDERSGLFNNNLLYLYIDGNGIFWIGSRGGGLTRWDRKQNTFKNYTIQDGLSHNVIYAIYEDDHGFLWMPSDYGLMRFEKETGICRTFLPSDGLPHEEFNRASYFRDSNGNFYFGGLRGFIVFNPNDILTTGAASYPLLLTKFEVINSSKGTTEDWTTSVGSMKDVILKPQDRSFVVHYAMLDFDDPTLKRYAYKIDGLDNNWNYLTENFIRINGLGGGTYELHIKGQSATGQWSENELVLPLRVMKPFFARTGTIIGLSLLLLGLTFLIYRRRLAMHKDKLEREREISAQLRQVDKLKDQFLANTSHELRTPLNGIVGLSESLLEKAPTKAMHEDLELIISSGRRLSNLVNDILDFSRLKEHDLQLRKKAVDMHSLAELIIRINKPLVLNKNIRLINLIPNDLPSCDGDENRLHQILQNLVGNAIKFTNAGSITINAIQQEGMLNVSIADTGIGIEKSKQEAIFREFEQADGSVAREFGGTGLGLSISRYLVELHGGTIRVESEPDKGSTFSFMIPLFRGDKPEDAEQEKATIPARFIYESVSSTNGNTGTTTNGHGDINARHILIVDDEPVNLKVLKNHLESTGYHVTMARDGEEALRHINSAEKFHLVLLDVMMPRISGFEVCQKIREKYILSELPVIMVTAKNQVNDLVEGLGYGANDYIIKPFSKDELLARVKTQLQAFDIHEATGRFVPHEFIQSLGRHGITDLALGDMVERNVHVMFSDIRDYTTLAEDMTPQENFKFVNSLAGKIGPLVKNHHGIINQYLGDTIMMLFMQKADDGVQTGIDILKEIEAYNRERIKLKRKPIRLGIGIHSGPLVMGIIGDSGRTDAAVISDTVNTASRMEGLTKHFNVNFILSEDTVEKLEEREKYSLRYLGKVQAKGKFHAIGVYECFDGDSAEQIRLKQQTSQHFHDAMHAYYTKDMSLALIHFQTVYQANPLDRTAFSFLRKVHDNLEHGLSEDWTGVELMQFK